MSNIVPLKEMQQMALATTKSGMFGLKNENQTLTLMMIAQAENIHPIQAVQMYSVINGMPSLKSTEVQARFQRAGGKINWKETSNTKAILELEIDGQSYTSEFSIEDAVTMGLATKDNWKKMPKQMCMARAVSMGVRAIYPACLNNMYSVDEMQDSVVANAQEAIEVDVEVIEETSMNTLKMKLANRLKELDFTSADIKAFADENGLADNRELLENIIENESALIGLVNKFEEGK